MYKINRNIIKTLPSNQNNTFRYVFPIVNDANRIIKQIDSNDTHASSNMLKNIENLNHQEHYISNIVHTTKYTFITFLPKCLFNEFKRGANLYFLIIAILQSIPEISPLTPITAIIPLIFVVSIGFIREGMEDYQRNISDKLVNEKVAKIYYNKKEINMIWKHLKVGHIVKINDNESIPADGILLYSSSLDGSCNIDASNLDGEVHLKERHVISSLLPLLNGFPNINYNTMYLKYEQPDEDLYKFIGNFIYQNKEYEISENQLVPRGSILRNTKWIYIMVVYTGHDTKMMKNAKDARHKFSNVERMMNKIVIFIFIFQIVLCTMATLLHKFVFHSDDIEKNYDIKLISNLFESKWSGFLIFLTYIVLLNTLIPISLVVTMEVAKAVNAKFIRWDKKLKTSKGGAISNTNSLMEELGQVKYLFSDKTGTLTQNKMEFKACSVGCMVYRNVSNIQKTSSFVENDLKSSIKTDSFVMVSSDVSKDSNSIAWLSSFDEANNNLKLDEDQSLRDTREEMNIVDTNKKENENRLASLDNKFIGKTKILPLNNIESTTTEIKIRPLSVINQLAVNEESIEWKFVTAIALCHTVNKEINEKGEINYLGDSSDEIALVKGAERFGIQFQFKTQQKMNLFIKKCQLINEKIEYTKIIKSYDILHIIEFNSIRRRMSIILRDEFGKIKIITKGADHVILDKCITKSEEKGSIINHIKIFADEGLRTLCYAEKIIDEKSYKEWNEKYHEAKKSLSMRQENVKLIEEEIEKDLMLLGATAIEDKLQENVPETISKLSKAGIKIWVVTGDKQETAVEIGRASHIIQPNMIKDVLEGKTVQELWNKMAILSDIITKTENQKIEKKIPRVLVIDGQALSFALMPTNRIKFLEIALKYSAVMVCRSAPLQKALVVELIKEETTNITLAVGDGANDVSMIRAAHVGVGLYGVEGMQAVRSSDYSIQQFSHLDRLLLYHGRLSYIRVTECINYFFYKNIIFTFPQFLFGIYCGFSGQTYFPDIFVAAYNVFFTVAPVLIRTIMEKKLPEEISNIFPELYLVGPTNKLFNIKTTINNIIFGIYQSILSSILPIYLFGYIYNLQKDGTSMDIWSSGLVSFVIIVLTVTFKMCLDTWYWTYFIFIFYIGNIFLLFGTLIAMDGLQNISLFPFLYLLKNSIFWLTLLLVILSNLIPSIILNGYNQNFKDIMKINPLHVIRRSDEFKNRFKK